MPIDAAKTTCIVTRGVMDVGTCDELDLAFRQIGHLFGPISLLIGSEATPAEVLSGLASVGEALAEAALDQLGALQIVSHVTEYNVSQSVN
ncbi:hypothetical protein GCM10010833_33870 [Blastomonas aquatica]|uniref:Uncharacterized protein n=2 Tax=Blastomonas aquatica TaxID=1510276 RepID=A0ABQ1JRN9_9SPHN|nr:hypothetical protein GCM10010833_33870 [Blastomonas aquatica]